MAAPFVTVLASRIRTDEKRIMTALDCLGVDYRQVDSRKVWGSLASATSRATGTPVRSQGIVLNREIGQTRAQYAAILLERAGAEVVNSARAVQICGDKWMTSVALADAGVPTPPTALALTPESALDAFDAIGYPAVVKPLTGSWGRLVTRVPDRETALTVLEYVAALPGPHSHIVYVQKMIAKADRDIRVIVVDGEPLGAVYRRSDEWRTNVARGAITLPCPLTDEIVALACSASRAIGTDIAGVDLIEDPDTGISVLEVNHGVEFSGFQAALGDHVNVAERIARYLTSRWKRAND